MVVKIPINNSIVMLFPEASLVSSLPRKKKKALKKKLAKHLIAFLKDQIEKDENNG
jgi:hypothetical protein